MADPNQQPQPQPTADTPSATSPPAQSPYPPPPGAPPGGYYPPPQGYYPGYYPPPGAPPPGQYPPPPGAPSGYPPSLGAPPAGYSPPPGAPPAGQHPPPPGAPPGQQPPAATPGAPPGQHPSPPGAPPAGQPPYPGYWPGYPPPGGYPGYPPPPGTPGQYGYPGYPPYGAPPPPQGYGHYPPPHGPYPPPPGATATPGTPAQPGQPPVPGAPPAGYPYAPSPAMPGYPAPPIPVMPDSGPTPNSAVMKEVWYLGTRIPDPDTPAAALSVTKVPGYDPAHDYNRIITMKSWYAEGKANTNEMSFVKYIMELPLLSRDALSDYCVAKRGKDLYATLQDPSPRNAISSNHVTTVVKALIQGPLKFDIELLYGALSGVGANEMILTEILLNRSYEEMALINKVYTQSHGRELSKHIAAQSDISLSADLKRLFTMALGNQRDRSLAVDHNAVSVDVEALIQGRKGKEDKERSKFIEIFVNRSKPHLAAVITAFGQKSKSLSSVIKGSKYFAADFKAALLFILHGVKPKRDGDGIWRDAKLLEKTMAGLGTKDTALVYRLLRAQWDPTRFVAVKTAYQNHYNKSLEKRVHGETSGTYRETLLLLIDHATRAKPGK